MPVTRWMRRAVFVLLAAMAFAAELPAQEARLSSGTSERLEAIVDRAGQQGVPPQLLRRKVTEGVSKGVEGARLERAIQLYADRLVAARRLAGPDAPPQVLVAAVEAAERGVPPARIRAFLGANPNWLRSAVGLRVLGELQQLGVPPAQAARGVNAALDRGMRGERLLALSAAVRRRVAAGEAPESALRAEVDVRRGRADVRRRPDRSRD